MSILEDIRAFVPGCEQEQRDREAMLEFLAVHEDAFLRTNLTAHMTASAWVLSRDRRRVVMVYPMCTARGRGPAVTPTAAVICWRWPCGR